MSTFTSDPNFEKYRSQLNVFVDRLVDEDARLDGERRSDKRIKVVQPVVVDLLAENGRPEGPSVQAVTWNVSAAGIGILHSRAINHKFVKVQLTLSENKILCMLTQVIRCRPLGLYYDIGGRFITRMSPEGS